MIKFFCIAIVCLFTSACMSTFHTKPYVAYADSNHPKVDTAIFTTNGFVGNNLTQILSVNDVDTSCFQVGCPFWVRVKPGTNSFSVRINAYQGSSVKSVFLDLVVEDMQPRHVYEALLQSIDGEIRANIRDLGVDSGYGVYLGAFKKTFYPAEF